MRRFVLGPEPGMKRREFIIVVGSLAAWPLSADAQLPKIAKIGVLVAGIPDPQPFWTTFKQALRDLGYAEGRNI